MPERVQVRSMLFSHHDWNGVQVCALGPVVPPEVVPPEVVIPLEPPLLVPMVPPAVVDEPGVPRQPTSINNATNPRMIPPLVRPIYGGGDYFFLSFLRLQKRSPDQVSSMAQTLLSTRPVGRMISRRRSSVRSVAMPDDFLGQAIQ